MLSGMKTKESPNVDPTHGSTSHFRSLMTGKEGFKNTLKQKSLAAALVCQQVSHLEGQAAPSKGICRSVGRRSFVSVSHLCASEEGVMLKKGSSVSSA